MFRATVVSVDDDGLPYVEVPELGVGYEFGPCQSTAAGPWERGDRVFVQSVAGILEDVVIVGRIDPDPDDGGGTTPTPGVFYEHTYAVPEDPWTVPHGLGRLRPEVTLTDQSGDIMYADVTYLDANTLRVDFANPTAGTVTVSL